MEMGFLHVRVSVFVYCLGQLRDGGGLDQRRAISLGAISCRNFHATACGHLLFNGNLQIMEARLGHGNYPAPAPRLISVVQPGLLTRSFSGGATKAEVSSQAGF